MLAGQAVYARLAVVNRNKQLVACDALGDHDRYLKLPAARRDADPVAGLS